MQKPSTTNSVSAKGNIRKRKRNFAAKPGLECSATRKAAGAPIHTNIADAACTMKNVAKHKHNSRNRYGRAIYVTSPLSARRLDWILISN